MPTDIKIGGTYLSPIAQALLLAWLTLLLLSPLLRRFGALQRVWHEALFRDMLYCAICASLIPQMGEMLR